MLFLNRTGLAAATIIAQALLLPAAAAALPVTFELTGLVTHPGFYAPQLAVGDPFIVTVSYDTDATAALADAYQRIYLDFQFEMHAGGFAWSSPARLAVATDGSFFRTDATDFGEGGFALEGPGLIPTGGALPTFLDLSRATVSHDAFGHVPGGGMGFDLMTGTITQITQTQGPAAVPEPTTLTLSGLGLAALVARRLCGRR